MIFSTDQSAMSLLNILVSKPSTRQEMLSDWSRYLTVFHMIGWSNMNERLHDMILYGMSQDVSVSQKNKYNKHLILILR